MSNAEMTKAGQQSVPHPVGVSRLSGTINLAAPEQREALYPGFCVTESAYIYGEPHFYAWSPDELHGLSVGTSIARVCVASVGPYIRRLWRQGTAVESVTDLKAELSGTSFLVLEYDNLKDSPLAATATRMQSLRTLAPGLSLRDWGDAFGVTKQAINNWLETEPSGRSELDEALVVVRAAAVRQPNLSKWLRTPLAGGEWTPLDLVREQRWRAFGAAARLRAPTGPGVNPTLAMHQVARNRRELSKTLGGADAPPVPDKT